MPKIIPLETTPGPLTTMDKLFDEVEAENTRVFHVQTLDMEKAQKLFESLTEEMEKVRSTDPQRLIVIDSLTGFTPGETVVAGGPSKGKV